LRLVEIAPRMDKKIRLTDRNVSEVSKVAPRILLEKITKNTAALIESNAVANTTFVI
jgi:hypothetical protein